MKILFKIPEFIDDKDKTEELLEYLRGVYNTSLDSGDNTYLTDVEPEDFTFGKNVPLVLERTASSWNANLRVDLDVAISAWKGELGGEPYKMDTQETYMLRKAAMAVDNAFYPFANNMVVIHLGEKAPTMEPLLPDWMLEDVTRNPAAYCIVLVYPK